MVPAMRLVKIGLASVNTTVGAFGANIDRALKLAKTMNEEHVTVAVFPEQLVGGYPSEDLIQMPDAGLFTGTDTSTATEAMLSTLLHEGIHYAGIRIMPCEHEISLSHADCCNLMPA